MKKIGHIHGPRVVNLPTASLDDLAVTEAKLGPLAVATAKIAADAVTREKLDAAINYWQLQENVVDPILNLANQNDGVWTDLDMDTAMAAMGLTVPEGAVGVIFRARLRDNAVANARVEVRRNGGLVFVWNLRVQVTFRYVETTFIVPLDAGNIFEYHLENTGNTNNVDVVFWLMGWVIQP